YYGEPLAKRRIQFGWNDASEHELSAGEAKETNEKGEFEFSIPTRPFEEEQELTVWARIEDEGAEARSTAFVAVVGVRASVSMLREMHLVGEKFDLSAETRDLADKPYA